MKRPSFQFYPDDWSGNSNLKRCTHEEKGIWMDVLCVLHDQDEYGVVRWPLAELAQAAGTTKAKLRKLVEKGVLKGSDAGQHCDPLIYVPRSGRKNGLPVTLIDVQDGPLWYSSRMVTDEHKRIVRGGLDDAPKGTPAPSPKGGIGDGLDGTPKGTPDPSPSRARPSSPSPSPIKDYSVPNGTGAGAPPPDDPPPGLTAQESLFQVAVPWLVARGMADKSARSLLGGAVKQLGPDGAWAMASECIRLEIIDPAPWLAKALNDRIAAGRVGASPPRRGTTRADRTADWNEGLRRELGLAPREKDMGVIDASS